jgi:hypothetical protein
MCIDTFIGCWQQRAIAATRRRAAWLVGDFSRWLDGRGVASRHRQAGRCLLAWPQAPSRPEGRRPFDAAAAARASRSTGHHLHTSPERDPTTGRRDQAEYVDYMRCERNLRLAVPCGSRPGICSLRRWAFDVRQRCGAGRRQPTSGWQKACRPNSAPRVQVEFGPSYGSRFTAAGGDTWCCAMPAPAVWSQSSIPRSLQDDQVLRTLLPVGLHRVGVVTTRSSSYLRSACGLAVVAPAGGHRLASASYWFAMDKPAESIASLPRSGPSAGAAA